MLTMSVLCKRCGCVISDFKGYDPNAGEVCIDCYKQLMTEVTKPEGLKIK